MEGIERLPLLYLLWTAPHSLFTIKNRHPQTRTVLAYNFRLIQYAYQDCFYAAKRKCLLLHFCCKKKCLLLQGFIKFRACFMTVETLQQSTSSILIYLRWFLIIGCNLSPSKSPKTWTAVNHSPKFGTVITSGLSLLRVLPQSLTRNHRAFSIRNCTLCCTRNSDFQRRQKT